ncbi:MAG: hypothetical protein IJN92_03835 [Lachnospiraceae bacterium]|nr:hypothetical protein [Lachnospiraceae bacterium]
MGRKKQPCKKFISVFLLVVILVGMISLELPVYATNSTEENNSGQNNGTNTGTSLTEEEGFDSYLSSGTVSDSRGSNAYGSWVAGTEEYKELYGSDYFEGSDTDNTTTSNSPNWISKAVGTVLQWEAYGINQLSSVLGLTVDNIVFGRLSDGVSISMFQFGLEYKNPFGTPGNIIYATLRDKVMLLALAIYVLGSLFANFIFRNKDTLKHLKTSAWMLIVVGLLLYIVPNLTDVYLFLRDAMTALIVGAFKTVMGVSGLEFDIFDTLFNYVESDVGFTTGLILLMCSGAGLFLGWNYVKNAMIAFAFYAFCPVILFICLFNKRLLGQWATRFYGILAIPFVDACLLMVPLFFTKMVTVKGALFVGMAMFFCVIPTRDALLAILGIRTEKSSGMFAAMLAMRMLGGIGKGRTKADTAATAGGAGQAGRMTNTEKADMLEAMGQAGESAPITNPLQQENAYNMSNGINGEGIRDAVRDDITGSVEESAAGQIEEIGESQAIAQAGVEETENGIAENAISEPVIAEESIGENAVSYTGTLENGPETEDALENRIAEQEMNSSMENIPEDMPGNGESLEAGETVLPGGMEGNQLYGGPETERYGNAAYADTVQDTMGEMSSSFDTSTREGNLRMMDATRGRMQEIQAKMQNNSLMDDNAKYSKQLNDLGREHLTGAISDKEFEDSTNRINAQMDKNNAIIRANNEKYPTARMDQRDNGELEKQYRQAQRDMDTYTQNEKEFASQAEAMGYGNKTYSSEASYRRAQELAERKRAFVTTNNFEDPAFRDVLSYREQADLTRERERLAQKREVERKVFKTAGALAMAPVGLAYMGIGGPESALMGVAVGASAGANIGTKFVTEKSTGLKDVLNSQQQSRDRAIKSEEHIREKAREKAERVRIENENSLKKETVTENKERKDSLQSLYDDQDKLAKEGISRLDELDK